MDINKTGLYRRVGHVCAIIGFILMANSAWEYETYYEEPVFSQLGQFEPDLGVRSRTGSLVDLTFPTRYKGYIGVAFIVIAMGIYKRAKRLEEQEGTENQEGSDS